MQKYIDKIWLLKVIAKITFSINFWRFLDYCESMDINILNFPAWIIEFFV